ncbi:tyrosine-type recombinase/integrase [Bacteroidota bacterium]
MATFKIRKFRTIVYAMCTHKRQYFKISTGLKIEDKHWNFQKHSIKKSYPNYESAQRTITITLNKLIENVNKLQLEGIEPLPQTIKLLYEPQEEKVEIPLLDHFRQFIQLKKTRLTKGTIKNFNNTLQLLLDFEKAKRRKISISSLDKVLFEKMITYMIVTRRYRDSTIVRHIRKIREFLKWAYPEFNREHIKYCMQNVEEPIYLTEDELKILINAKLTGYLNKTRDLFVFCATTGMRYSDTQRFKPHWIKHGLIEFRMLKTGGKAIVPLFKTTKEVLENWNDEAPRISQQKFNDYLKILFKRLGLNREVEYSYYKGRKLIQEIKPLYQVITSHIGRKTFITLCLMKGIAIQDVMKMSGHSDYRSMRAYISIPRSHLVEVAKKWDI